MSSENGPSRFDCAAEFVFLEFPPAVVRLGMADAEHRRTGSTFIVL
jgi:hypothetical protein